MELLSCCWKLVSFQFAVAVDGNWSDWNDWSDCPVTCGGGVQNRSRTCTNPSPQFGGAPCPGESDETRSCNEEPCPSKIMFFSHNNFAWIGGSVYLGMTILVQVMNRCGPTPLVKTAWNEAGPFNRLL